MKKILYLSAFALYFLAACAPAEPQKGVDATPAAANSQNQQLAAPALVFDVEKPSFKLPKDLTIESKILRPRGGAKDVSQSINDVLQADYVAFLTQMCEDAAGIKDADAAANCLAKNFTASRSEEEMMGWEMTVSDTILFQSPQFVCIMRGYYSFAGGAHPNSSITAFNFDVATGRRLTTADIFTDPSALLPIVEKKFKAHWAEVLTEAGGDYQKAGFDFANNKFTLPQNILIGDKEVTFSYNPYEVAPYVMGPTDIVIPKSDIINLMKVK
jgi:hypothetical protein